VDEDDHIVASEIDEFAERVRKLQAAWAESEKP
jgi:hypothetical protein